MRVTVQVTVRSLQIVSATHNVHDVIPVRNTVANANVYPRSMSRQDAYPNVSSTARKDVRKLRAENEKLIQTDVMKRAR